MSEKRRMIPPPDVYSIALYYKIGEKVTVIGLDFTGVVVGMEINATLGVLYKVDNGIMEKSYPAGMLQREYEYFPPGPMPCFNQPELYDEKGTDEPISTSSEDEV